MSGLKLDHIVLAVPNLKKAIDDLQENFGITAIIGGKHVGFGTHNALLGIGQPAKKMYLEIIAIDPEDTTPHKNYFFGLQKEMKESYVAAWCLRCEMGDDIEKINQKMSQMGVKYQHGSVRQMQRQMPTSAILSWRIAAAEEQLIASAGQVPFLICWDDFHSHPTSNFTPDNYLDFSIEFSGLDNQVLENNLHALGFIKPPEVTFSFSEKTTIKLTLRNARNSINYFNNQGSN
ncbi:MAG TPA: VOC family protein [Gammaproteobacteria bacterium]|nr:VOC family protein [Gammaproteobacteria bacterium]